jgi:hypothetical protein
MILNQYNQTNICTIVHILYNINDVTNYVKTI